MQSESGTPERIQRRKIANLKSRRKIAEFADEFLSDYGDEIKDIILCDADEARHKIKKLIVDFSEYLDPNDI